VLISISFADIFKENSLKNGVLTIHGHALFFPQPESHRRRHAQHVAATQISLLTIRRYNQPRISPDGARIAVDFVEAAEVM